MLTLRENMLDGWCWTRYLNKEKRITPIEHSRHNSKSACHLTGEQSTLVNPPANTNHGLKAESWVERRLSSRAGDQPHTPGCPMIRDLGQKNACLPSRTESMLILTVRRLVSSGKSRFFWSGTEAEKIFSERKDRCTPNPVQPVKPPTSFILHHRFIPGK
jgi:hypothetical protein